MTARIDILDEPERLRGPFFGSLLFHGSLVAVFVGVTTFHILGNSVEHWGDPNGGRMGAVAVSAVNSIPLPNRGSVPNPVANDTESHVPAPPPKQKAQPKPKTTAPDANAIPIKSRNATRRETGASQPNKWAEKQTYRENQVYSGVGQAANSPMFQMRGGGGVGIGTDSPLGTQFGWYANALLTVIGQHWHPTNMDARAEKQPATIQFTILRDGSLVPGSVKLIQSSGSRDIDYSAQRALLDIDRFSPLPAQFPRDRVDLQVYFDLRH
jgi:protein TonB